MMKQTILQWPRIIMPNSLRHWAILIAHEGHQGIVKTKQLISEKIWFPGIDKDVKEMIGACLAYQVNSTTNRPSPVKMNELSPELWYIVYLDFCGPFPTGVYLLVATDAYSRFAVVEIIHSTSASTTISKLERIFSTYGLPQVIKSDNGPPFNSMELKTYMQEKGIKHQWITPLWPQANLEAENFMKPMEKAIKAAHTEHKNCKKELYSFSLNYIYHTVPPSLLQLHCKIRYKTAKSHSWHGDWCQLIEKSKKARNLHWRYHTCMSKKENQVIHKVWSQTISGYQNKCHYDNRFLPWTLHHTEYFILQEDTASSR